ncbi:MAG: tRNA (guanosine(37)-N1)-methyltransferase TrmD [Armatimonadota bacterium]
MRIDVLTTFPEMFDPVVNASILKRAQESGIVTIEVHDLRRWTTDKHHTTDDAPFGGGGGMVMKPEPFFAAVESLLGSSPPVRQELAPATEVILLTPQGEVLTQALASQLSTKNHLILLCGHYEGVDERVREHLATREVSIGDYVLTGGELPAMVVIDAVTRLLPGALGAEEGAASDSFALGAGPESTTAGFTNPAPSGLLEYPQYTRPADFRGWKVPGVLLSGNHEQIRRWRRREALRRTLQRRPELIERAELTEEDRELLGEVEAGGPAGS